MKHLFYLLMIGSLFFCACKKSDSQPTTEQHPPGVPTSAETRPQYDNSSFGVYKGVVIGSSGIIILKVNNGDNTVKGYLTIDNQKDSLTTTETPVAGQPLIDLAFTGKFSSMKLSADTDGSNAQITQLFITGHPNANAIVAHENSNRQVLLYEGRFSGDISGTINLVKVGTEVRSGPVEYVAKVATDNYFMRGLAQAEVDSASRKHSHYMYDLGGYERGFTGYITFNLSQVTGSFNSYVHSELRSYRGTLDCKRTY